MIDIQTETLLNLHEAAQRIPAYRTGRRCHVSALNRWISRGCVAVSGRLVRLDAVRLGNRWVTSVQALQRFADRLTRTGWEPLADAR